jgi:hypothetical protein
VRLAANCGFCILSPDPKIAGSLQRRALVKKVTKASLKRYECFIHWIATPNFEINNPGLWTIFCLLMAPTILSFMSEMPNRLLCFISIVWDLNVLRMLVLKRECATGPLMFCNKTRSGLF